MGLKNKNRKITNRALAIVLVMALVLSLAGCNKGGSGNDDGASGSGSGSVSENGAGTDGDISGNNGQPGNNGGQSAVNDADAHKYDGRFNPTIDHTGVYGKDNSVSEYDLINTNYALSVDTNEKVHDISDLLYGIFFEDINFAADGGLYAEMVQNRSFEFSELAKDDELHAWSKVGKVELEVIKDDKEGCLNANNPNYLVIKVPESSASGNSANGASNGISGDSASKSTKNELVGIANYGFLEGMSVKENEKYNFSLYAKSLNGFAGSITVRIVQAGNVLAEGVIEGVTDEWAKYALELVPSRSANNNVTLQVLVSAESLLVTGENATHSSVPTVALDMVSLMPEDTENGLRKDLVQALRELEPAFVRFPGGCVIEGSTLDKAYDWKASIGCDENGEPLLFNGTYGDVAARRMGENIWTDLSTTNDPYPSFMSYGLGFYEFFVLSESIGAIGVPVINCGVSCMGRSTMQATTVGSEEYNRYVQDALDLVEFCRGDENTKWGSVRIAMGHEKPFELKYVGIGNEQWGDSFFNHYEPFVTAFEEARKKNPGMYGDIELIYSAGTDDGDGSGSYMASYANAKEWLESEYQKTLEKDPEAKLSDVRVEAFAGATDHHYYNTPDWFLYHNSYYDEKNYSRSIEEMTNCKYGGAIPVFLGEYAAKANNWGAALAEASYMTGLERNGDIVVMSAYAPLFGNTVARHWAPNLIWFNNHTVTPSVNYYVQQLFMKNAGKELLASKLEGAEAGTKRYPIVSAALNVGFATYNTSVQYKDIVITDNESGEVVMNVPLASESDLNANFRVLTDGEWTVNEGVLKQASNTTDTEKYAGIGSAVMLNKELPKSFTMTLTAKKLGGSEGFMILVGGANEGDATVWSIGGVSNTSSVVWQVNDGIKGGLIYNASQTFVVKPNREYKLKIVVNGNDLKCYINDEKYVDISMDEADKYETYHVVSRDENGDVIIKLVNVTDAPKTIAIDLNGMSDSEKTIVVEQAKGKSNNDDNILGEKPVVVSETFEVQAKNKFNFTVPKYSVTVLRVPGERDMATYSKLEINEDNTYQTWEGFGCSGCWWTQYVGGWDNIDEKTGLETRDAIARLLYSRQDGIGLNIYRYNMGAGSMELQNGIYWDPYRRAQCFETAAGVYDWNKDAEAVWFLNKVNEYGGDDLEVVFFSNSPLCRLTMNGLAHMSEGGPSTNLAPENYEAFAKYVFDVAEHFIEAGIPITEISPINEPQWDWFNAQEGCHYDVDQFVDVMKVFVNGIGEREALSGVKISGPEGGDWNGSSKSYVAAILRDSLLKDYFTTIDNHSYWTSSNDKTKFLKYMNAFFPDAQLTYRTSEWVEMRDGYDYSMDSAYNMAEVIMDDMNILNVTAWSYWVGAAPGNYRDGLVYLNQAEKTYDTTRRLYEFGNFSKFIRPGYVRVDVANKAAEKEVEQAAGNAATGVTAAENAATGVTAAENAATSATVFDTDIHKFKQVAFKGVNDYGEEELVVVIINHEGKKEFAMDLLGGVEKKYTSYEIYTTSENYDLERTAKGSFGDKTVFEIEGESIVTIILR